jgi:hypothetical protein
MLQGIMKFRGVCVAHLALPGVLLFLCIVGAAHAQSGWTQKKRDYLVKGFVNYTQSDRYFNLSGEELQTNKYVQLTAGLYGEYGISDRFTVLINWPTLKHQYFETTEKITGMGDMAVGVKYGILQGAFPLAVTFTPEIPLAKANNYAQNKELSFVEINLPTGDGEWNFLTTLAMSHSFGSLAYASLGTTFNYRTQFEGVDFNHQLSVYLEGGVKIADKFWINVMLKTQNSLGESVVVDFVRGEGTEYTAYKLGAFIPVYKQWNLDLAYFNFADFLVERKNLYSAGVYSFGVLYEMKK